MSLDYGIFDITGPVIIGPSSSHTAGACRLANAARAILNREVQEAVMRLYGSFAYTLMGHGTDKALVGGLMGIGPDDERLTQALHMAQERGMAYRFEKEEDLSNANRVLFQLAGRDGRRMQIRGTSVGGGSILIDQIDDTDLAISLKYNTLVVDHPDRPGAVLEVSRILAEQQINIAAMKVYRKGRHGRAYMIVEMDQEIPPAVQVQLRELADMRVIYIDKLY